VGCIIDAVGDARDVADEVINEEQLILYGRRERRRFGDGNLHTLQRLVFVIPLKSVVRMT